MLLGDGCLYKGDKNLPKNSKNVFYCMNHSINQSDYALWKAKLIDKICIEKNINKKCTYSKTRKFSKKHNKTYNGIYVKFSWAKYFRFLRRKTYINIPEDRDLKNVKYILSQLYSPLHIAIWFLDDSSEKRKKRKSVVGNFLGYDNPRYDLFTYSFTEGQHQLIKQWFENKYNVSPSILISNDKEHNRYGRNRYLSFSVADTKKLFLEMAPYFSQTEFGKNKFRLSFARYLPEMLEMSKLDKDIAQTTTEMVNES